MRTNRTDSKTVDLEFLKEEFNRFRSELAGMKDKLGSNASDALAGRLKGSGKVAVNRLETEVSNKPLVSIALAFGAGLLVSQLLRRG